MPHGGHLFFHNVDQPISVRIQLHLIPPYLIYKQYDVQHTGPSLREFLC